MSAATQNGCRFPGLEADWQSTHRTGEGISWQTIEKKIRVAVSKAEVNRRRAAKVKDRSPAGAKASRADNKGARVANKAVKVRRVASRAPAKFWRGDEVSSSGLTSHCDSSVQS
jgi:hypothetical protein